MLNRYRVKSSIEGSNPSLSARQSPTPIRSAQNNPNTTIYAGKLPIIAVIENLGVEFLANILSCFRTLGSFERFLDTRAVRERS